MKNDCLNVWKGLAAFFIILIHVSFPSPAGGMVNGLARFGVPLFFMVSGFFCYRREMDTIRRRGRKILGLFLGGNGIYFLWKLLILAQEGIKPLEIIRSFFTGEAIWKWVVLNQSPMEAHLWFLGALLYCYLFFGLLVHLHWEERLYFLIPLCLGLNLLLGVALPVMGISVDVLYTRNFWLTGLPFFLLGHWLAGRQQQGKLSKVSHGNLYCLSAIALGAVMSMAEMFLSGGTELYLGSIFMVSGMFLFALWNPSFGKDRFLARVGERDAFHMYLWQMIVFDLVRSIANVWGVRDHFLYEWLAPVLVCFFSWLLAEGIHARKNKMERRRI